MFPLVGVVGHGAFVLPALLLLVAVARGFHPVATGAPPSLRPGIPCP